MKILRHRIELPTTAPIQILDVTGQVRDWVEDDRDREGLLTVTSLHTTARVNVNEREPQLEERHGDLAEAICAPRWRLAAQSRSVDGRDNAHSHILGLLMNSSESIPVADGEMVLGELAGRSSSSNSTARANVAGSSLQIMGEA